MVTEIPDKSAGEVVVVSVDPESGRERVMRAAYELFSRQGTRTVGVDAVISEAGVAKMTLYRNFASKDDLILAFLERRETLCSLRCGIAGSQRRGDTPVQRLMATFEIFGECFAPGLGQGCCCFTTRCGGTNRDSAVRQATV